MLIAPKIIVAEGISGAGKTAIKHVLGDHHNNRDLYIPRFTPSMWVYQELADRPRHDYEALNLAMQQIVDLHVVWLRVEPSEALRRKRVAGDLERIEDLALADQLFERYFNEVTTLRQVHVVDTDGLTVAEVGQAVIQKVYYQGMQF